MKNILVVYYTQSGQLKKILDNLLQPIQQQPDINVQYLKIEPGLDFPFPWKKKFFDCFPESVLGIPCKLKPFDNELKENYDLVILGFQSWYLSPPIPMSSFLQHESAKKLLNGKNVITVQGVRNMWIQAQEIIKKRLKEANALLVGNIVLGDRTNNYIAGITIIRWLVHGKQKSKIFPDAGVSEKDINASNQFGDIILESITKENYNNLQKKLVSKGSVRVKHHLLSLETTARKIFIKLANFAFKKGDYGSVERKGRITIFKMYLIFAFFIVSPFVLIIIRILGLLTYNKFIKESDYYKGVTLR